MAAPVQNDGIAFGVGQVSIHGSLYIVCIVCVFTIQELGTDGCCFGRFLN